MPTSISALQEDYIIDRIKLIVETATDLHEAEASSQLFTEISSVIDKRSSLLKNVFGPSFQTSMKALATASNEKKRALRRLGSQTRAAAALKKRAPKAIAAAKSLLGVLAFVASLDELVGALEGTLMKERFVYVDQKTKKRKNAKLLTLPSELQGQKLSAIGIDVSRNVQKKIDGMLPSKNVRAAAGKNDSWTETALTMTVSQGLAEELNQLSVTEIKRFFIRCKNASGDSSSLDVFRRAVSGVAEMAGIRPKKSEDLPQEDTSKRMESIVKSWTDDKKSAMLRILSKYPPNV